MKKQIVKKYRIVPLPKIDPRGLIFDTKEEVEAWLKKAEVELHIEIVEGEIVSATERTGFCTGRRVKVWKPLK